MSEAKVFIVMKTECWEEHHVDRVFATLEAAKKYLFEQPKQKRGYGYYLEDEDGHDVEGVIP